MDKIYNYFIENEKNEFENNEGIFKYLKNLSIKRDESNRNFSSYKISLYTEDNMFNISYDDILNNKSNNKNNKNRKNTIKSLGKNVTVDINLNMNKQQYKEYEKEIQKNLNIYNNVNNTLKNNTDKEVYFENIDLNINYTGNVTYKDLIINDTTIDFIINKRCNDYQLYKIRIIYKNNSYNFTFSTEQLLSFIL